jgi:hypothetical protein
MKKLQQLCAGLLLTIALTATALAGQMDCPGATEPPPQATVEGEMPNVITETVILLTLALV